jgi:hypothetical protein
VAKIEIGRRFCGPPESGNGGYVCGVIANSIRGPATAVLGARVPLDRRLDLMLEDGVMRLTDAEGSLIGRGSPATDPKILPKPPEAPSMKAARAAGERYIGVLERVHPTCFTCGPDRHEGDGLRVFVGQVENRPAGQVAGVWTPHMDFGDAQGLVPAELVWAALDCPGFFAWVAKAGRHGALLGTMTCEVLKRPRAGEETIVMGWPLERDGRKETSGVALFAMNGEVLARGHQVWITLAASFPAQAKPAAAA